MSSDLTGNGNLQRFASFPVAAVDDKAVMFKCRMNYRNAAKAVDQFKGLNCNVRASSCHSRMSSNGKLKYVYESGSSPLQSRRSGGAHRPPGLLTRPIAVRTRSVPLKIGDSSFVLLAPFRACRKASVPLVFEKSGIRGRRQPHATAAANANSKVEQQSRDSSFATMMAARSRAANLVSNAERSGCQHTNFLKRVYFGIDNRMVRYQETMASAGAAPMADVLESLAYNYDGVSKQARVACP